MGRAPSLVFVDSGAWMALAAVTYPLHERAAAIWQDLQGTGAKLLTSVLVVVETFTFLDRRGSRTLALRWRDSLATVSRLRILDCGDEDLKVAFTHIDRRDYHRLSLVDATSFVLMARHHIRYAFAFDAHFVTAGFRLL